MLSVERDPPHLEWTLLPLLRRPSVIWNDWIQAKPSRGHMSCPSVLAALPAALVKYSNESKLREEGFISLTVPGYHASCHGIHSSGEPENHITSALLYTPCPDPMLQEATSQHLENSTHLGVPCPKCLGPAWFRTLGSKVWNMCFWKTSYFGDKPQV